MSIFSSCIYSGLVTHRRFKPKKHFFSYKTFSLLIDLDELKDIEKKIIFFSIIYLIFLLLNFKFSLPYSGGIFYKISDLIFSNNYFFYFVSFLSFYFFLIIFKNFTSKKNFFLDLILFILLILMEIDGIIYHEAYDPLFYILSFLLLKNTLYFETIKSISIKSLSYFYIFGISFFTMSIIKSLI